MVKPYDLKVSMLPAEGARVRCSFCGICMVYTLVLHSPASIAWAVQILTYLVYTIDDTRESVCNSKNND